MSGKPRVGIVGVGAMGLAVTERLIGCGFPVTVRDIRAARERAARRLGARLARTPAELARECAIVITLVLDAKQTAAIALGRDGLVRGMRPGGVVLMCSTVPPAFVTALARKLAACGVLLIDAPVSGGPARAAAGTMSMMVAGPTVACRRAQALLRAMSDRRFDLGSRPGDGSAAKIVNNLLAGVNLAAGAEGLALGLKLGLEAAQLLDLIAASSGQSWIAEDRLRRAIRGDYGVRAAPELLAKDLGIAIAAAGALRARTPLARAARAIYRDTIAAGYARADDAAVLKLYASRAGVRLPRAASGARSTRPPRNSPRRPRSSS